MSNSTLSASDRKSGNARPDTAPKFPLFKHASGQWAKKVRGKLLYFGTDQDNALAEWIQTKDDLLAGRTPEIRADGLTLSVLCNKFLRHRESRVATGEITQRTWDDYQEICKVMLHVLGRRRIVSKLKPLDFQELRAEFAKGRRAGTVFSLISRSKAVFNFAYRNDLIELPVKYGTYFDVPSQKTRRKDKASQEAAGQLDLQPHQIRDVLNIGGLQVVAMALLGVNVGMGNEDVARLEFRHVDLHSGWLDFPRPKTFVMRRAWLWSETRRVIQAVIDQRKEPAIPDHAPYIFLTKYRQVWFTEKRSNPLSAEFRKLLKASGHYLKGRGFYSLRRTFETVAANMDGDWQPTINLSMGRADGTMASLYRQRVSDRKLQAVSQHVRQWLWKV